MHELIEFRSAHKEKGKPNPLLESQSGEAWKPFLDNCGWDTALTNSKTSGALKQEIKRQRKHLRQTYTTLFAREDRLAALSTEKE